MYTTIPGLIYPHEAPVPAKEARWLVPGILRHGVPAALVGHGEEGKGCLLTDLALAVAAGATWMGRPCDQGKVLILSAEDDGEELLSRLHDIAAMYSPGDRRLENILLYATADAGVSPSLFNSNMAPGLLLNRLEEIVAAHRPSLVILDTLAALGPAGADLTGSSTATQYITGLMSALQPTPTVLFSHHLRKPGGREKDGERRPGVHDMRDSSAIAASMRCVMILHNKGLSVDKCNGRRRTKPAYVVPNTNVFRLEWECAPGAQNGALRPVLDAHGRPVIVESATTGHAIQRLDNAIAQSCKGEWKTGWRVNV